MPGTLAWQRQSLGDSPKRKDGDTVEFIILPKRKDGDTVEFIIFRVQNLVSA